MCCRQGLLEAVAAGDIDIISSDHSPAPGDMKETQSGDFLKAWGGISGKGCSLSWSDAYRFI
jgi:allantoinase